MCQNCEYIKNKYFESPKNGDLRVWWIPQVPMEAFYYPVRSIAEAKHMLEMLAFYDLFQYEHKVKPDYANVGGLQIYDEETVEEDFDGWCDWYNDDGEDIDRVDDEGNTIEE
jgi:hypothetical protein